MVVAQILENDTIGRVFLSGGSAAAGRGNLATGRHRRQHRAAAASARQLLHLKVCRLPARTAAGVGVFDALQLGEVEIFREFNHHRSPLASCLLSAAPAVKSAGCPCLLFRALSRHRVLSRRFAYSKKGYGGDAALFSQYPYLANRGATAPLAPPVLHYFLLSRK